MLLSQKETKKADLILIVIAACFWGSMWIFVRRLAAYGFDSIQIVSIRVTLAALIFCLLLFIQGRSGFRISVRDIPLFIGLRSVEAGKAGIIATIEPVVATIVGIICFSETLTLLSGTGIILILAAVIILNFENN